MIRVIGAQCFFGNRRTRIGKNRFFEVMPDGLTYIHEKISMYMYKIYDCI